MLDANEARLSDSPPAGTELPVAATVVLVRDGAEGLEVLLLERPRDRGSFAGAWVFPGGRVDPEDAIETTGADAQDADAQDADAQDVDALESAEEAAARRAGVREVREETALELSPESLVTTARWTPPHNVPKRFRTWFFIARAPHGEITLTPQESIDYAWIRPAEALQMHGTGALSLVPPTWITLHGLRDVRSVEDALAQAQRSARRNYATRLGSSADGPVLFWGEDVAYADDALVDAPGGRHRLEIGRLPWVYSTTSTTSTTTAMEE
jgi:8-oxo-dGTP pyrophosphatase MutT (NUDIX family)